MGGARAEHSHLAEHYDRRWSRYIRATVRATRRVAGRRLGSTAARLAADAEALPFGAAAFDVVVTVSSLHHWTTPARGAAEMARVLHGARHRVHGLDACARLVTEAGLTVTAAERYKVSWLWGMMTVSASKAAA